MELATQERPILEKLNENKITMNALYSYYRLQALQSKKANNLNILVCKNFSPTHLMNDFWVLQCFM